MHHIYRVACIAEGVRHAMEIHGISAKTVWRVKCREIEEFQRPGHALPPPFGSGSLRSGSKRKYHWRDAHTSPG